MKRFWTDADFPNLSWHNNCVSAFRVIEGEDGAEDLVLDIDHIVEWIESEKRYDFRVAPAELRFRDVADLRMNVLSRLGGTRAREPGVPLRCAHQSYQHAACGSRTPSVASERGSRD